MSGTEVSRPTVDGPDGGRGGPLVDQWFQLRRRHAVRPSALVLRFDNRGGGIAIRYAGI